MAFHASSVALQLSCTVPVARPAVHRESKPTLDPTTSSSCLPHSLEVPRLPARRSRSACLMAHSIKVTTATGEALPFEHPCQTDPRPLLWFDIDNCLYSRSTKIDERMGVLIQGELSSDIWSARADAALSVLCQAGPAAGGGCAAAQGPSAHVRAVQLLISRSALLHRVRARNPGAR